MSANERDKEKKKKDYILLDAVLSNWKLQIQK